MGKRPRIKNELIGEVIVDEIAYVQNKSSKNARKILDKSEHIEIEIWCDKHYYNRVQLGDENGKREGIEEDSIKDLVIKSIQHLFYYSFKVKNFSFINFGEASRNVRIVLQEHKGKNVLNVVVEFHHLEKNKYQVTVITAMQKDDFSISVGQYALQMDDDSSILRKFDGKNLVNVDNL